MSNREEMIKRIRDSQQQTPEQQQMAQMQQQIEQQQLQLQMAKEQATAAALKRTRQQKLTHEQLSTKWKLRLNSITLKLNVSRLSVQT